MRAYFSRRYRLSASHRLYSDAFSDERNVEVYGKCSNPHGHGHNYTVEVTVAGQVDPVTGMVCNMVELDECVQREIIDLFGHTNLNLYPGFHGLVPTTEAFCVMVYEMLSKVFDKAELVRVRIEETNNNSFEYPAGKPMAVRRVTDFRAV
ncbi:MAG TPA: 6-carboxytetrahydropterin synthase [Acidisarcina sp.]